MKTIYLHGDLKSLHPDGQLSIAVDSPQEALSFLSAVLPGFKQKFQSAGYFFKRGDSQSRLPETAYDLTLGQCNELHILPDPTGKKIGGAPSTTAPESSAYEGRDDEDVSALFNGGVNTTEQGLCVPIIYGRVRRAGSAVISAGISVEDSAL